MKDLPFSDPLPETILAIEAALNSAKVVMEIYNQDFTISEKGDHEPITEADIKSNQIIESHLSSSKYPILSEESFDKIEDRIDSKRVWIVDPLDGTSDFVKKTGEFTIMIALVENHSPIIGVISNPAQNILYVAQKGQGAFRFSDEDGWKRLQVSNESDLSKCKAVGSRFHQSEKERQLLQSLSVSQFTSRGSSLKVIDICSKTAELYFTMTDKIKQWDTCASYCLVSESGGKMTDMEGKPLKYNTEIVNHLNGILVTNGIIHHDIAQKYLEFKKV